MGGCIAKNTKCISKQRKTLSSLADKSVRQDLSHTNNNVNNKQFELDDDNFQHYDCNKIQSLQYIEPIQQNQNCERSNEYINQNTYISCFHAEENQNDVIGKIVLLEEACITLKHKMEQEKSKHQLKFQQSQQKLYNEGYSMNDLNLQNQGNFMKKINFSNPQINSQQITQKINEQNNQNILQLSQDILTYQIIIKLADFIQEKSQCLWDNPNNHEIHDALSRLFWASSVFQLDCLLEFKQVVSKLIHVIYDYENLNIESHLQIVIRNSQKQDQYQISS